MKKKNLWHLLAIMMVAVLSIGFAACGVEDNVEANGGSGNAPSKVSNSVLSSRLKDKDGNPVFLTYNGRGYRYASDGKLIEFGELDPDTHAKEEHFVVDGLKFKSGWEDSSSDSDWGTEGTLELNQDGLITKAVIVGAEIKKNGQYEDKVVLNFTFYYDAEKQLIKIDEDAKREKYDDNGNLEEVLTGHGIQTRT